MQRSPHRSSLYRRAKTFVIALLATTAISLAVIARPALHLALAAWQDAATPQQKLPLPTGMVEDASHLNPTPMTVVKVSKDWAAAQAQLKNLLKNAQSQGKNVAIAGSRHTMGGQTLHPNGIALDMQGFNQMRLNTATQLLTVQSGATWAQVIPYLNQYGYSVAVMQSNNNFSVGGTLSANAHGWQHNHPPFASTVESFQLMVADGSVVTCSRHQNPQLFSLVLGGYGLFGIILNVNLNVVPNELYSAQRTVSSSAEYGARYQTQVNERVGMAYGRLSVAPDHFLKESILTTYHRQGLAGNHADLTADADAELARTVFVGSIGSNYGKALRWQLEKMVGGEAGTKVTRNQILNRPAELFENHTRSKTDILHEYFIPVDALEAFLGQCRQIIPKHNSDLLNVTVRNVYPDHDAFLRYADQPVFGLVMLFHQDRTATGDAKMQALAQALIDAALAVGGRYYLPYRLHATPEQFHRAYPQAAEFFRLKRKYDPEERFYNKFYGKYGKDPQVFRQGGEQG
jgi:FAD/FMN-containing dehydrogenase